MTAVLIAMSALAAIAAGLSWLADRHPCIHPEWIDLGDGDAVCTSCDAILRTEDVR